MFDDLRNSASSSYEEEEFPPVEETTPTPPQRSGPLLGMSPQQRFLIALLVLLMTCILGSFCLLLTEKIVLPIF
ncbi:MAG: hypothetical protein GYA17_20815 [Chloroflexi bacterium]|jgi:hypothetical protein|nr:hypothetical protein [Anaerolineaceae bacterium]NMB90810.1 hypothetical protein [Chloroflexota bacterium]